MNDIIQVAIERHVGLLNNEHGHILTMAVSEDSRLKHCFSI